MLASDWATGTLNLRSFHLPLPVTFPLPPLGAGQPFFCQIPWCPFLSLHEVPFVVPDFDIDVHDNNDVMKSIFHTPLSPSDAARRGANQCRSIRCHEIKVDRWKSAVVQGGTSIDSWETLSSLPSGFSIAADVEPTGGRRICRGTALSYDVRVVFRVIDFRQVGVCG